MITINLLPVNDLRHRRKGRVFVAALGLGLFGLAAGLFAFKSNFMDAKLERLGSSAAQQQAQLAMIKKEVDAASAATAATAKKWQRLEAIIELEERRRDLTRILVELNDVLPQDSAWLLSLSHNEGQLTIEGISKDKEIISQFLSRLEGAEYIAKNSVNLLEIAQNMVINEISLTRFKISAQTVFPQPRVLEAGLPDLNLPPRAEMVKAMEAAAPDLATGLTANVTGSGRKTL